MFCFSFCCLFLPCTVGADRRKVYFDPCIFEETSRAFAKSLNALLLAWVHSEGRVRGGEIHILCEYKVVCDWINLLICFNLASLKKDWQDPSVLAAGDILCLLKCCSWLVLWELQEGKLIWARSPDFKKQCAMSGVMNNIPKNSGLTAAS